MTKFTEMLINLVGLITLLLFPKGSLTESTNCTNVDAECIALEDCTGLEYRLLAKTNEQIEEELRQIQCGLVYDGGLMVCCPSKDTVYSKTYTDLLPDPDSCGVQVPYRDRITGGERAEVDEHPWLALLGYSQPKGRGVVYPCGGALISSRYVMTAAHCIIKKNFTTQWAKDTLLTHVRLGESEITTGRDCYNNKCNTPAIDVPIEMMIPHPSYVPSDVNQEMYYDIGLLRLIRTVVFTDFIRPICLPVALRLRKTNFDGYEAEVAGWGRTENNDVLSPVKMKVKHKVIDSAQCKSIFARVSMIPKTLTKSQICAGGLKPGADTCLGDSGNPLMVKIPNSERWMAIGILSYGYHTCGERGVPAVFTQVRQYMDWILLNLKP